MNEKDTVPASVKDPMKSFRGVMGAALVLEAISVGLALPVIATLGGGITSFQGWVVMGIVAGLLVCLGLLRFGWTVAVILALQVALIAFIFTLPSLGAIGVLFLAIWLGLLRMRAMVAKQLAQGILPSQQEGPS